MDAIQEFEQYCALHPDPWYLWYQAKQEQEPLQSISLPPLQSPLQGTQATQQSIPPAPQAKKEEANVEETRPQPLYQATVEDDAETTPESTKHGNSMLAGSKSPDSKQLCRKWAPHTGFLATLLVSSLTSFLASHGSQLSYIRCMEEMEASGEG